VLVLAGEFEVDAARLEVIEQLRESMEKSRKIMLDDEVDRKVRERWTQLHTNTAAVLERILRSAKFAEWERRMRELEAAGQLPPGGTGV